METITLKRMEVNANLSPYSLGKLIEWKRSILTAETVRSNSWTPYSLGKLIEWKPCGHP